MSDLCIVAVNATPETQKTVGYILENNHVAKEVFILTMQDDQDKWEVFMERVSHVPIFNIVVEDDPEEAIQEVMEFSDTHLHVVTIGLF